MINPFQVLKKNSQTHAHCQLKPLAEASAREKNTKQKANALKSSNTLGQGFDYEYAKGQLTITASGYEGNGDRPNYYRKLGASIWQLLCELSVDSISIEGSEKGELLAIAEGMWSKNYRFEKYKSEKSQFSVKTIGFIGTAVKAADCLDLAHQMEGVFLARDLVNEPANKLTATELSKRIQESAKSAGYKVSVLQKAKIQALKMGGLLAVNKGSSEAPTFNILEYTPKAAKDRKPIILIGKGIVYDTGGLSLKPTANSMDIMKSDMAGAAAVIGAVHAAAKMKLPINLIALIPATDNQPGPMPTPREM